MTSRPVIDDLSSFWMPFTANRQFKAAPRLIESAKGMYYRATDGREILDGCAGLWCVNAGHCRDEIVAAIQQQAATLDFAPTFQMGHPLAFEAASKVAAITLRNCEASHWLKMTGKLKTRCSSSWSPWWVAIMSRSSSGTSPMATRSPS